MSEEEKKAMKGEVLLDIVEEPMDHFTTWDDNYLSQLLRDHKTGEGLNCVILKDKMKELVQEVMGHWYNIKGAEFDDYVSKNFDKKWLVLDNRNKGQIDYDEGTKFIRDFISATVQL